jgi:hypothetical protein
VHNPSRAAQNAAAPTPTWLARSDCIRYRYTGDARSRASDAPPCLGSASLSVCGPPGNEAGECYVKLSECHLKLDSKHEAASALVDAANAYKKTNKKGARGSTATWERRADAGQKRSPASRLAPPSTVDCYLIAHACVCAESANCLNKAADYFTDLGRLSIAAKHFKVCCASVQHLLPMLICLN